MGATVLGTDVHRGFSGQLVGFANVAKFAGVMVTLLKKDVVPIQFKPLSGDEAGPCDGRQRALGRLGRHCRNGLGTKKALTQRRCIAIEHHLLGGQTATGIRRMR